MFFGNRVPKTRIMPGCDAHVSDSPSGAVLCLVARCSCEMMICAGRRSRSSTSDVDVTAELCFVLETPISRTASTSIITRASKASTMISAEPCALRREESFHKHILSNQPIGGESPSIHPILVPLAFDGLCKRMSGFHFVASAFAG